MRKVVSQCRPRRGRRHRPACGNAGGRPGTRAHSAVCLRFRCHCGLVHERIPSCPFVRSFVFPSPGGRQAVRERHPDDLPAVRPGRGGLGLAGAVGQGGHRGERGPAGPRAAVPGHRLHSGHAGGRRAGHPFWLSRRAGYQWAGAVWMPARAGHRQQRGRAGGNALRLWCHARHLRLRDEHSGRHRRARQQPAADVRFPRFLQPGWPAGRGCHQQHHGAGGVTAAQRDDDRCAGPAADAGQLAPHAAVEQPVGGRAGLCAAAGHRAVSGGAVLHRVSGGGLDDGLERRVPHRTSWHVAGAGWP